MSYYFGFKEGAFVISDEDGDRFILTKDDVKDLQKALKDKKKYPWNSWMKPIPKKKIK